MQRTARFGLDQDAMAAAGVNLKQFKMKNEAFNNHVFVNTVFICKRGFSFYDSWPSKGNCTMDNL